VFVMRSLLVVTCFVAALAVVPAAARQARQGDRVQAQPTFADDPRRVSIVPVGAKLELRLQTALDSGTAKVDQRFGAATSADYVRDGRVLIPPVTPARGFVSSVRPSSSLNRTGSLTLSFDEMKLGDQSLRLRASVEQIFTDRAAEDSTRLGADAAVLAAMGRMPGGGQPLLVGVRVGAGGSIDSTQGADVHLPIGTILRIRIDRAMEIADVR
jgi:hypothetical protein